MISRPSIIAFLISVLFFLDGFSQQNGISDDSLKTLHGLSFDYAYDYDYKNAIEVSGRLVEEAIKVNNDRFTAIGYGRLGSVHSSLGDTIKSLDYYRKALRYAEKTKQDTFVSGIYNDIGNVYVENGGGQEKAIQFYKKSIQLNKDGGGEAISDLAAITNIGWTYLDQNNPEDAIEYLNKARGLQEGREMHPLWKLNLDILFGRYYLQKAEYDLATTTLKDALVRAEKGNYLDQILDINRALSKVNEAEGNLAEALRYHKELDTVERKINKINTEQSLLEASSRFKLEQYQEDLALAQNQQSLTSELADKSKQLSSIFIVTSIVLSVALLAFFLLFRNRKKYIRDLNKTNVELVEAKDEAERLSNLKTQFFSTVSHELRTPLYGVIGLSSILLEDEKLKSHKDDLKSLKFSANYLLALINDVLTLNKVEANGMKLEKTSFKLKTLVKSITDSFTFSLQQNNNRINVVIDEAIPNYLLGDSVKLSQILMNLVGNAVKFNENGTVEIIVRLLEKTKTGMCKIQFFVKDNGVGIPKEKQESIFEEFSQVENNNYNYQGTGLGLPIVKKLLALYGSKIDLKSEMGNGSIFSFIIELEENVHAAEVDFEEVKPALSSLNAPSFEDIHILIVDDNKINQKVTQKILEARNFKTDLADDGIEAVEKAQKRSYGLILMDIHMPKMGGIEATRTIRSFNAAIPIIALTAVEIEEARAKIMDAGMNDIILKPYDVSQFLTVILRNLTAVFADK